jgi:hypothetical protein
MNLNIRIRHLGSPQRTLVSRPAAWRSRLGSMLTLMGPAAAAKVRCWRPLPAHWRRWPKAQSALGFEGQVLLDGKTCTPAHGPARNWTAVPGRPAVCPPERGREPAVCGAARPARCAQGPDRAGAGRGRSARLWRSRPGHPLGRAARARGADARAAGPAAGTAAGRTLLAAGRCPARRSSGTSCSITSVAHIPVVLVTHDHADIADPSRVVELVPCWIRRCSRAIRPLMVRAARVLVPLGVGADALTWTGFCWAWARRWPLPAALSGRPGLLLGSRLMDGLDGAVARATQPTDRGGFLDITLDFLFYAAIPLAFAVADPAANALPQPCCWPASSAPAAAFWPSPSWPKNASCSRWPFPTRASTSWVA